MTATEIWESDILRVKLKEGIGAIHLYSISAIVPDRTAPKTRSLVFADIFPEGITVDGKSTDLIVIWEAMLKASERGMRDEEDDESVGEEEAVQAEAPAPINITIVNDNDNA